MLLTSSPVFPPLIILFLSSGYKYTSPAEILLHLGYNVFDFDPTVFETPVDHSDP